MLEHMVALGLAAIVLALVPGPNVALIVANSLRHGFRFGLATVLGTTFGIGLQLSLVVFGLATLLALAADALVWLKWLGVAYLVWLGIRAWMEPADDLSDTRATRSTMGRLFRRGLGLAMLNPKTLLFNAALLPQFVPSNAEPTTALLLAGVVLVTVLALVDTVWCACASSARLVLVRYSRLRNRLTGGLLIASGFGLALARRVE
jgi:threonine/homoserine/homoserine lactone efflux protein